MKCAWCGKEIESAPLQISVESGRIAFPCKCAICYNPDGSVARCRHDQATIGVIIDGFCQWVKESSLAVYPTKDEKKWMKFHGA